MKHKRVWTDIYAIIAASVTTKKGWRKELADDIVYFLVTHGRLA